MSPIVSASKVAYKTLCRTPMLWSLRNLVDWEPLVDLTPGYTIVIAGMYRLWPVAVANLRLLAACDRSNLAEVLLVMDEELDRLPPELLRQIEALRSAGLPIRLLGYTARQRRIAHRINWGWVYSWMSWSKGIAAARTQRVVLHDLDAMPIGRDVIGRLVTASVDADAQFQGIRYYDGSGVTPEMRLVTTFEMVIDVEWLRRSAKPIEGFNQIRLVDGRYVDFDTWLEVQRRAPRRRVEPIDACELVHPSQLICQFTDLLAGRLDRLKRGHQLPILHYFCHIGDSSIRLDEVGRGIEDSHTSLVTMFDRHCDLTPVKSSSWAWMEKQIRRLEQHLHGSTRPHVEQYLCGFVRRAGEARTVGREPIDSGGIEAR